MRLLLIFLMAFVLVKADAQESIIVERTTVDWKDYPGLYEDVSTGTLREHLKFFANINMQEITYISDGLKIQAFAAIPKEEGTYPVIIFNRGGNRDSGALQLFKGKGRYAAAYHFSKLASEGYVVIGCNYRGCGASEGQDEFGGKDVNDVLNLINVVKEIPAADEKRIGMYGWSRGGMMTYLALTKTDEIKAAVVGGAPSDKTVIDRPEMENGVYAELIPNYWDNKEEELKKRSAVYFADQFPKDVPILMLHGNADWRVKSSNSLKLAMEFDTYRVPYRLKIFEGGDHSLRDFRAEVDADVIDWFDRFLKNGESSPSMEWHGK